MDRFTIKLRCGHLIQKLDYYLPPPLTHTTERVFDISVTGACARSCKGGNIVSGPNIKKARPDKYVNIHVRIHLSCLKAPIVQDPQYGGKPIFLSNIKRKFNLKQDTEEQPLIQRVALHAHSLSFFLMDGESVRVEAPYPKDMDVLIKQLDKWG